MHLELGGKAPVVVFDDADIAAAAEGIAIAGYFNAGQDCTAATRVIAGPGVYDDFVAALAEQATGTRPRQVPDDEDVLFGPVNNPNQLAHVARHPRSRAGHARSSPAATQSARRLLLRADRHRRPASGRRDDPARDLRPGHHRAAVHRRRRGGAVGPTASSTGSAPASGRRTSAGRCAWPRRLDFGCVWINTHIPLVAEMPHGGFKKSGYGKDLSAYALEDYTRDQARHVLRGGMTCRATAPSTVRTSRSWACRCGSGRSRVVRRREGRDPGGAVRRGHVRTGSGARFGPMAIRQTDYLAHDGSRPSLPLRTDGLVELNVVDAGDVEMFSGDIERPCRRWRRRSRRWCGRAPFRWCWGVTTPSRWPDAKGVANVLGHGRVSMIHFDAHADTGDIEFGSLWGTGSRCGG